MDVVGVVSVKNDTLSVSIRIKSLSSSQGVATWLREREQPYKSRSFVILEVWSFQVCVNALVRRKDISNDLTTFHLQNLTLFSLWGCEIMTVAPNHLQYLFPSGAV